MFPSDLRGMIPNSGFREWSRMFPSDLGGKIPQVKPITETGFSKTDHCGTNETVCQGRTA